KSESLLSQHLPQHGSTPSNLHPPNSINPSLVNVNPPFATHPEAKFSPLHFYKNRPFSSISSLVCQFHCSTLPSTRWQYQHFPTFLRFEAIEQQFVAFRHNPKIQK